MSQNPFLGGSRTSGSSNPVVHSFVPAQNADMPTTTAESTRVSNASNNKDNEIEGDEDEDEDEEDDDMTSELSDGSDLQEELGEALGEADCAFEGNFYHASILPFALNPCLSISGLGIVGLPLSERDAKAIVACSTLAPFGHGERTVVDKDVRDTWEIDPSRISFGNTGWKEYVDKTLCVEICKSLGITVGNSPPKMELYKLLLYETGSHFLPHQDTQKADGIFATAIILLPSAYTGGQVVVSHSSSTKTIEFSQQSLQSTALLAWYTDVRHEVKPVTSGYRLALSYNLIHVAPTGVPPPSLPDMSDSMTLLRRVLRKWKEDKYQGEERNIIAYLLHHEYSAANLKDGLTALKGSDLNKITQIRPIAEELGFKVGLARLEHNISGYGDDDGCGYHRRSRYRFGGYRDYWDEDEDDEDEDEPGMGEVEETTTSISGLVDLNGVPLLSVGTITIDDDCVIPKDPFEGTTPDNTEYEGYMGNGAGSLDYWYRRTVLVLMDEDKIDNILYSAEGAPYAMLKLKESSAVPPTSEDRRWVNLLITNGRSLNNQQILTLLDYSFKWKDLEMCKKVAQSTPCTLATVGTDLLLKAWDLFSFGGVCLIYETLLARSTKLSDRMDFISALPSKAGSPAEKNAVNAWCTKESDKVLSSYSSPEGIPYAFQKLKESSAIPPTQNDRRWATLIIRNGGQSLNKDQMTTLIDYTGKWKDLEMWKAVAQSASCSLQLVDKNLLFQACAIFSFEEVRVVYEAFISHSNSLADRLNFVSQLPSKTPPSERDAAHAWFQKQAGKALSSYTTASAQEIPTITGVIRLVGLSSFKKIVMPNLIKRKDNYAFWIAFVKALHENRQTIVNQETKRMTSTTGDPAAAKSSSVADGDVKALIKECLQAAAGQWDAGAKPQTNAYYYNSYHATVANTAKIDRIIDIIENAILISDLEACKPLFLETFRSAGTTVSKFKDLYCPLIPRLRDLLTKKGQDICRSPFIDFMQLLIGLYLRDVLGKMGQLSTMRLRKVGCGCRECNELDKFLLDFTRADATFRFVQIVRTHLERQLATARDLCTHQTIKSGSSHGLHVTKLPAVVEASTWAHRQKTAKIFLASIGPETVISKIMGTRYAEVKLALDGVKQFGGTVPATVRPAPANRNRGRVTTTTTQTAAPNAATASKRNTPATAAALAQMAGQKRKLM